MMVCSPITIGVLYRPTTDISSVCCLSVCTKSVSIRLGVTYAHKWIEAGTAEHFRRVIGAPCPLAVYSLSVLSSIIVLYIVLAIFVLFLAVVKFSKTAMSMMKNVSCSSRKNSRKPFYSARNRIGNLRRSAFIARDPRIRRIIV